VIGNADDVARLGGVGDLAVLREEQDRRMDRDRLAQARRRQLHPALEGARNQPHEGDAVAVLRVHVGLHLEDEAGDFLARSGAISPCLARLRAGRRGIAGDRVDQFGNAEILERRSEIDRRQVAVAIGIQIEFGIARLCQLHFLGDFGGQFGISLRPCRETRGCRLPGG
jgi:hypothetical protein